NDDEYQKLWTEMQKLFLQIAPDLKHYFMSETPRELEKQEIIDMEDQMASQIFAAINLGFDGVEIHSPHGYLIHSFLSARSNKRKDEYGGSLENRARFLTNIIRKTRAKIGPDKPLGARFSGDECMPGGVTREEAKQFVALAEEAGVNFINTSQGSYENPTAFAPHGEEEFIQYGPGFKESSGLPVIVPGFI
ncbi:MAG: NADH:flavin oxidoreductase, partial [bacterium]|nr:NADH:flavin oxidoreductase [bacterium]